MACLDVDSEANEFDFMNTKPTRSIKHQFSVLMVWMAVVFSGCAQVGFFGGSADLPSEPELTSQQREELDIKFGLTRIIERKGQIDDAKKSYLEIVQVEPSYHPALHRLGVIAAAQEDLQQAIEWLESAAELNPDSAELLGDLGYTSLLSGQIEPAQNYLNQAFNLAPDDPRITNNLALVKGYQGKLDEALSLFRRCNPESQALANIGYLNSQLGDLEQARHYFHAALNIDPTVEQAANGLVEIEKLSLPTAGTSTPVSAEAPRDLEVSITTGTGR